MHDLWVSKLAQTDIFNWFLVLNWLVGGLTHPDTPIFSIILVSINVILILWKEQLFALRNLDIQKCLLSWLWRQQQIQVGQKYNTHILSITVNCTLNAQFFRDIIPFFAWLWLWQHKKPPVSFCLVFSLVVSFVLWLVLKAVGIGKRQGSWIVQRMAGQLWFL